MRPKNTRRSIFSPQLALAAVAMILLLVSREATAQAETVLYNFGRRLSGTLTYPSSTLVADQGGNLFGAAGCVSGHCWGGVFELNRHTPPGEPWAFSQLFGFYHQTGEGPSGLTFDKTGNLYGTAATAGIYPGFGTAFELSPTSGTHYSETLLYSFQYKRDGWQPESGLIFGPDGNLYGTTLRGGPTSAGTLFQLVPPTTGGGPWTRNIIFSFDANTTKKQFVFGCGPLGTLTRGPGGVIYGATGGCGRYDGGILFQWTPGQRGITVIHAFGAPGDGIGPSSVVVDSSGHLYGTTNGGGINNAGTVFELTPPTIKGGPWTENVLYSFTGGADGGFPTYPVALGANGVLYSTIAGNRSGANWGLIYQLTPPATAGDPWTHSVLHTFTGGDDGGIPSGGVLVLGGALYGTTTFGGTNDTGVVYEITF